MSTKLFSVKWDPPADQDIASYQLYEVVDEAYVEVGEPVTVPHTFVPDVEADMPHTYVVKATNTDGLTSDYSDAIITSVPATPDPPSNVVVELEGKVTSQTLE